MLSIKRCREVLGNKVALEDDEIQQLRDQLYSLANAILDISPRTSSGPETNLDAVSHLMTEEEAEEVSERAAVREFDGHMPREEAERAAVVDVIRKRRS